MSGLLTACNEMEINDPQEQFHDIVITATIDDATDFPQTRTCVDMSNSVSGILGILWNDTDCIGVYSKNGSTKNAKFKSQSSGNVRKADFGGSMIAGDEPWRAYYPYSEDNDGVSYNSLKGTLPSVQPFDSQSGALVGDYKYGAPIKGSDKFNFRHIFSLLRISIDATDTELAGDQLESIVLTVTDPVGNERQINGSFVFSADNGSWGNVSNASGTVSMPWNDTPTLTSGQTYTGFVTVMPTIMSGDKISVTVNAGNYKASFAATCNVDFESENVYNIPLKLSGFAANSDKFGYKVSSRPALTSFSFNVSDNEGKILNNECTWNSSSHTPSFASVSEHEADIEGDDITLTIPYLYDFKLVPTFIAGDGCTVAVNGDVVKSGETEIDFTNPVIFTVSSGDESRDYTVRVTNTGLPIVVLKQSNSGDFSEETIGGWMGIGGTTVNDFVGIRIRGKEMDWVEDDQITVYNSDGSYNLPTTLCGARLRGNTSREYPKKPFAIKLTSKSSILGMPAHKRWVLLANWLDHSMIRNGVAFDIAHAIENAWRENPSTIAQGIPWNVHGQNVELVFVESDGTGHHVGNYYLCEQIKIDEDRLNIKDPYDAEDNPAGFADCGYLLEFDMKEDSDIKYTTSNGVWVKFKNDEPKGSDVYKAVSEKIQGIEDDLDNGNYTEAYNNLDINSMVDQFLIWELTMNREYGDPGSIYMFMDGNGKLSAGPVWDFDRGTFQNQEKATNLGNSTSYRVKPDNAWMFQRSQESEAYSYVWYRQLAKDATFRKTVVERWAVIRPYLDMVVELIGEYGENQAISYKYNSVMWPTNKADITKYKSDFKDWSGDEQLGANGNYQEVIDNFVTVYQERLAGMDGLIEAWKEAE